jgi:hypothetical protein
MRIEGLQCDEKCGGGYVPPPEFRWPRHPRFGKEHLQTMLVFIQTYKGPKGNRIHSRRFFRDKGGNGNRIVPSVPRAGPQYRYLFRQTRSNVWKRAPWSIFVMCVCCDTNNPAYEIKKTQHPSVVKYTNTNPVHSHNPLITNSPSRLPSIPNQTEKRPHELFRPSSSTITV